MTHHENGKITIPAINFFITPFCNMRCKFCFGKFEAEPHYTKKERHQNQLNVIQLCADAGIEKITFVGGEPLLSPWIDEEIAFAHALDMCTCVVTNGSLLTEKWLHQISGNLDWIGISIDSLRNEANCASGRTVNGNPLSELDYRQKVKWIRDAGIRLKINTTVTCWNWDEDMSEFFRWASPDRMKIFQALSIDDINTDQSDSFMISEQKFDSFIERHRKSGVSIISETASDMKGSYLMVTPGGRFFENIDGLYRYSSPITDVGYQQALSEIRINMKKFHKRGGIYHWS